MPLPSATASSPAFAEFARAADARVDDPHAVAAELRCLLVEDGWLAPADRVPGTDTYRQHLLHVSADRRLSVVVGHAFSDVCVVASTTAREPVCPAHLDDGTVWLQLAVPSPQ